MDLSELKQVEQSEKPSGLIRRGAPMVEENHMFCGCALGAAFFAKTGALYYRWDFPTNAGFATRIIGDIIGLPEHMAIAISDMHCNGKTREQCADWLEAKGY